MTTPACELRIDLTPSRRLVQLIICGHLAAAVSLFLVDIQHVWRFAGGVLIALHGCYVWWDSGWLRRLIQLKYLSGAYQLVTADGDCRETDGRAYLVMPWLVILEITIAGKPRLLPLMKDSCHPDDLRRLRVLLRVTHAAS